MNCKAVVQENKEGIWFQFESQGILKSVEKKERGGKKNGHANPFLHLCALWFCVITNSTYT